MPLLLFHFEKSEVQQQMSTMRVKNKDGTWDKVPVLGSYQAVLAANEAATNAQNAADEAGLIKDRVEYLVSGNFPYITPEMFGAIGDGVADDTQALKTAISTASALKCMILAAKTYLVSETLTITNDVNEVNISGTIRANFNDKPVVVFDNCFSKKIICNVLGQHVNGGYTYPTTSDGNVDYENLNFIGIQAKNCYQCKMSFNAQNCNVGVQMLGDSKGCVYNVVELFYLGDNVVSLDLNAVNKGWVNENLFLGGRFTNSSSNDKRPNNKGIRIGSTDNTYNNNNNNVFIKPSFEMGGLPVHITGGINNTFIKCRCENGKAPIIIVDKGRYNRFDVGYSTGAYLPPLVDNTSYQNNSCNGAVFDVINSYKKVWEYKYDKDEWLGVVANASSIYGKMLNNSLDCITSGMFNTIQDNLALDYLPTENGFVCRSGVWGIWADVQTIKKFMIVAHSNNEADVRLRMYMYDGQFNLLTPQTGMISSVLGIQNEFCFGSKTNTNHIPTFVRILDNQIHYVFFGIIHNYTPYLELNSFDIYTTIENDNSVLKIKEGLSIFKRQPKINSMPITNPNCIKCNAYVGRYISNADMTQKTDDKGNYITKGYLCTAVAEDGTATWVEDKLYL